MLVICKALQGTLRWTANTTCMPAAKVWLIEIGGKISLVSTYNVVSLYHPNAFVVHQLASQLLVMYETWSRDRSMSMNCHTCDSYVGIIYRGIRSHSNDIRKLTVPRTHNKLGDRSFSAAGPRLWNDLPPGLRRPGLSFDSFRRSLKTHLFGNWSA